MTNIYRLCSAVPLLFGGQAPGLGNGIRRPLPNSMSDPEVRASFRIFVSSYAMASAEYLSSSPNTPSTPVACWLHNLSNAD